VLPSSIWALETLAVAAESMTLDAWATSSPELSEKDDAPWSVRVHRTEDRAARAEHELLGLRAGLADSQARHQDTALLLERLAGQNAALRARLGGRALAPAFAMNEEGLEDLQEQFSKALRAGPGASPEPCSGRSLSSSSSCGSARGYDGPSGRAAANGFYATQPNMGAGDRRSQPGRPEAMSGRRTCSPTPSAAGSTSAAAEMEVLRHRMWELERNLEIEKRRSAMLYQKLDESASLQRRAFEATPELENQLVTALRHETAQLKHALSVQSEQSEQLLAKSEAATIEATRSTTSSDGSAIPELAAQARLAGALRQELRQECEAVHLLHGEEQRLASAGQHLFSHRQQVEQQLRQELSAAEASASSWHCRADASGAGAQSELEALAALRAEASEAAVAVQRSRAEAQLWQQQLFSVHTSHAKAELESRSLAAERDRWKVQFESLAQKYDEVSRSDTNAVDAEIARHAAETANSRWRDEATASRQQLEELRGVAQAELHQAKRQEALAEEYQHEVRSKEIAMAKQKWDAEQAVERSRSTELAALAEVAPLKAKLEEVTQENSNLCQEGRSLRQQLLDQLREASQTGDRLLESWERCRALEDDVSRLRSDLADAREEADEVAAALVDEQSQASVLRCRLRELGLLPPNDTPLADSGAPSTLVTSAHNNNNSNDKNNNNNNGFRSVASPGSGDFALARFTSDNDNNNDNNNHNNNNDKNYSVKQTNPASPQTRSSSQRYRPEEEATPDRLLLGQPPRMPSTPADHAAESGSFLFLESRPGEEKSGEE
ncbi:unnamed protein product, partial [Polarella glacialis]